MSSNRKIFRINHNTETVSNKVVTVVQSRLYIFNDLDFHELFHYCHLVKTNLNLCILVDFFFSSREVIKIKKNELFPFLPFLVLFLFNFSWLLKYYLFDWVIHAYSFVLKLSFSDKYQIAHINSLKKIKTMSLSKRLIFCATLKAISEIYWSVWFVNYKHWHRLVIK